jgi:hypothetical protein
MRQPDSNLRCLDMKKTIELDNKQTRIFPSLINLHPDNYKYQIIILSKTVKINHEFI